MDWCCELMKIPSLVEHYNEQAEDTGITFFEFFDNHYGDRENSQNHENDSHDGELPLQGHHSCAHGISLLSPVRFEFVSVDLLEKHEISSFYQSLFSSASLGSLFQPPQV